MDWYPWYFTLYEQDTMHLDPYQDGCYRRLIDHYMKTRTPLPDNDQALARIIGDTQENWGAKASLAVRAFFKPKNGFLCHNRCDDILDEQDNLSKTRSKSAKIAANTRWKNKQLNQTVVPESDAPPMRDACEPYASPMRENATGQDRTRQDNKDSKYDRDSRGDFLKQKHAFALPDFIPKELWQDYIDHRKKIKKPMTENAQKLAIKDLERFMQNGHDPVEIIKTTIVSGWTAFYEPKEKKNGTHKSSNSYESINSADDKLRNRVNETARQIADLCGD